MYSAVAARIFIEIELSNNNDSFPGSISDQANWWALMYTNSNENVSTFVDMVQTDEATFRKLNLKLKIKFKQSKAKRFETY